MNMSSPLTSFASVSSDCNACSASEGVGGSWKMQKDQVTPTNRPYQQIASESRQAAMLPTISANRNSADQHTLYSNWIDQCKLYDLLGPQKNCLNAYDLKRKCNRLNRNHRHFCSSVSMDYQLESVVDEDQGAQL